MSSARSERAKNNKIVKEYLSDLLNDRIDQHVDKNSPDFARLFGHNANVEEISKMTFGELLARQLMTKACGGDMAAIKELLDRLLGKATQVNENINIGLTYDVYLDNIAEEEGRLLGNSKNSLIIDVPPIKSKKQIQDEILGDLGL